MSQNKNVWVSHPIFPEVIDRLKLYVDVITETSHEGHAPEYLKQRLGACDGALLSLSDLVDETALIDNTRLKVIANMAAGFNNLDLTALARRGIIACTTPGIHNETVADYAWALLLTAARRVNAAERWVRAGQWKGLRYDDWLGADVHEKTLGILGMGRIGQAVARRAQGFCMTVLYNNREPLPPDLEQSLHARYVDKATLLGESDHLVILVPYSAENHHLIGPRELQTMRSHAVLVNIARGGIVDDAALATALREGRLGAAALDVFEGEPAIHPDLLALDNVVLSPHIASAAHEKRLAMALLAADNVIAALGLGPTPGEPPTAMDLSKYAV